MSNRISSASGPGLCRFCPIRAARLLLPTGTGRLHTVITIYTSRAFSLMWWWGGVFQWRYGTCGNSNKSQQYMHTSFRPVNPASARFTTLNRGFRRNFYNWATFFPLPSFSHPFSSFPVFSPSLSLPDLPWASVSHRQSSSGVWRSAVSFPSGRWHSPAVERLMPHFWNWKITLRFARCKASNLH